MAIHLSVLFSYLYMCIIDNCDSSGEVHKGTQTVQTDGHNHQKINGKVVAIPLWNGWNQNKIFISIIQINFDKLHVWQIANCYF